MGAKEHVKFKFLLYTIELLLESFVSSHHEIVQDVVHVRNGFEHGKDRWIGDHIWSKLSSSQVRQRAQDHVECELFLCEHSL